MASTITKTKVVQAMLALLRIVVGCHFLYEGLTKIFNPAWSARPYLEGSRWIFGDFFRWLASGDTGIQIVNTAGEILADLKNRQRPWYS